MIDNIYEFGDNDILDLGNGLVVDRSKSSSMSEIIEVHEIENEFYVVRRDKFPLREPSKPMSYDVEEDADWQPLTEDDRTFMQSMNTEPDVDTTPTKELIEQIDETIDEVVDAIMEAEIPAEHDPEKNTG